MIPLEEIRKYAAEIGLTHFDHLGKAVLIHAIQEKEGHEACFDAPWCNVCVHESCRWREDCRAIIVTF